MKGVRKLLVLVLALVLGLSIFGCGGPRIQKVIRIGAMDANDADEAMLTDSARIAQSQGYLEEELQKAGYEIEYVYSGWGAGGLNEMLLAGQVDVLMTDLFSQLILRDTGTDIKAIAAINTRVHNGIAVQGNSGITDITGLAGKKLVMAKDSMQEYYFEQLAAKNNFDTSTLAPINSVSDTLMTFLTGGVDAINYGLYSAYYMGLYMPQNPPVMIASTLDDEDDSLTGQSFVSAKDDFWKKNPEAAKAIVRALLRAQSYAAQTAETDVDAVFTAMSKDATAAAINKRIYGSDLSFSYFKPRIETPSRARMVAIIQYLREKGTLRSDLTADELIDNSYCDAVLAESV